MSEYQIARVFLFIDI